MIFGRDKTEQLDDYKAAIVKELEEVKKEIRERLHEDYDQLNQYSANDLALVDQEESPNSIKIK